MRKPIIGILAPRRFDKAGYNNLEPFNIKDIGKCKYKVFIDKDSRLFNIFKDDVLDMPSLHNSMAREEIFENDNCIFKVTGISEDKIIEVIESKNDWWCVGGTISSRIRREKFKII